MSTLYIVATPIGNLKDISLRALEVLKEVDLIACEDTRHTKILLNRYEITTPTVSYHQHSRLTKIDWLVEQLLAGKNIALVSDAGTPGINDPGGMLVQAALESNYKLQAKSYQLENLITIVPIPGANTAATLLSASGIPADSYFFIGYLPTKKGRQTQWKKLKQFRADFDQPIVLFESPHRFLKFLTELKQFIPEAQLIVGRELTKQFEEIWRGNVDEALLHWEAGAKGEFVVIIR